MLPLSSVGCTWGCPDPDIIAAPDPVAFRVMRVLNDDNSNTRVDTYALSQQGTVVNGFARNPVAGAYLNQGVFFAYNEVDGATIAQQSVADARNYTPTASLTDLSGSGYFCGRIFDGFAPSSGVSIVKHIPGSGIAWTADITSSVSNARPLANSLGFAGGLTVVCTRGLSTNMVATNLNTTTGTPEWVREITLASREASSASSQFGTVICANMESGRVALMLLNTSGTSIVWQRLSGTGLAGNSFIVPTVAINPDGTEFVAGFFGSSALFTIIKGDVQTGTVNWIRSYECITQPGYYSINWKPTIDFDGSFVKFVFDHYEYNTGEQVSIYVSAFGGTGEVDGVGIKIRQSVGYAYQTLLSVGVDPSSVNDSLHLSYLDSNNESRVVRLNTGVDLNLPDYSLFSLVTVTMAGVSRSTTWTTPTYGTAASSQTVTTTPGNPTEGTLYVRLPIVEPL